MINMPVNIELWKLLISSIIIIGGWKAVDWFSKERDMKNKQREVILLYLIEAYRGIEDACGRDSLSVDQKTRLERAIADVQLFGLTHQIQAAKEFTERMNKSSNDDPRFLLAVLRYDLRHELNLPKSSCDPQDIIHWRLK